MKDVSIVELDGIILSPTREKLEPTIPKKDDNYRGSQRNSPKKDSPLKKSAQRSKSAMRNGGLFKSDVIGSLREYF